MAVHGNKKLIENVIVGGGEMGTLMRALDWSQTQVGLPEQWPQSLRTAISIMLDSYFPMYIAWGNDYIQFYNDGYRPILGSTKHPAALGLSSKETFAESWHIIGPLFDGVMEGKAVGSEEWMLPLDRHHYLEECFFNYSYSPIREEGGGVGGVLVVVAETTNRVLSERRLRTLRDLAFRTELNLTVGNIFETAIETFKDNAADIPFALLYACHEADFEFMGGTDLVGNAHIAPAHIAIEDENTWPLRQAAVSGQAILIDDVEKRFGTFSSGPWPESITKAIALPIIRLGQEQTQAVLIIGISPRRAFDENYQNFLTLVVGQISTAITKAHAYEEERKRSEGLAELDRAKTEFFSNVSHEFRTPLTLMLNPLQELANEADGVLSEAQRENVEIAQRNSLRLLKLVNTLLDFSRIQSNRIQASFEASDLSALTADFASNFRSIFERNGLHLVVNAPTLSTPVYVDHDMWEKIVVNLLSNAFKFTFEGEVEVSLRTVAGQAELTVRDSGIGIPEDELPHIFARFYQVPGARSRLYEGSGIGLALVAELVRFHGGHIQVASTVGVGTIFTVSIPLGSAHLAPEQIRSSNAKAHDSLAYLQETLQLIESGESNNGSPLVETAPNLDTGTFLSIVPAATNSDIRILVVDDNADMRSYLSRLLEKVYVVKTANDGVEALDSIHKSAPDLVVADVMMPNLDGFGLLQRLRSDSSTRGIPIILLSARAGQEARIEGLQAGADDYLTKPFAARELLASIESQLQLAHLRREVVQTEQNAQMVIENIIENITYPFYMLDRELRFIYVNIRALEIWGKKRQDLVGKQIWQVFPVNSPSVIKIQAALNRAIVEQHSETLETVSNVYTNGVDHWWEADIYPSSTGVAVYFRDISERKEAERLRERLELVLENMNTGFLILDQNWRYVYANPEAAAITTRANGTTREQLLQTTLEEGFPEIVGTYLYNELKRSMAEQVTSVFEVHLEAYGLWLEYRLYPSAGDLAVFVGDITQRKQEEVERIQLSLMLENERQRFANIIATVPGVIWENEHTEDLAEMKLIFISAYIETMLGYTVQESLAEPHFWRKIFHPEDSQKTIDAFYRVRLSGGSGVVNFRAVHKNGSVIDVQAIMITVLKDDKPIGKRGVMM
ncbi:MAG: response regulator, partial [Chloroflexota bacterium]